jgi:nitrite reductase/ring-hydroxylating ferredoxin subunit
MDGMQTDATPAAKVDPAERRSFITRVVAAIVATIAGLFPLAVGLGVIIDPLRRARGKSETGGSDLAGFVPVCPLDALEANNVPRAFAVTSDLVDAWTHAAAQKIGEAFLARSAKDPNNVTAFTATCPHLGCAVEFDPAKSQFECPCHKSGFAKDGEKLFGPSRRGLDPLPVKIADKGGVKQVWIKFERFKGGIAERKPLG